MIEETCQRQENQIEVDNADIELPCVRFYTNVLLQESCAMVKSSLEAYVLYTLTKSMKYTRSQLFYTLLAFFGVQESCRA